MSDMNDELDPGIRRTVRQGQGGSMTEQTAADRLRLALSHDGEPLDQPAIDWDDVAAVVGALEISEARVAILSAERDEARDWVRRLTAEQRTLTCVYCGHAYPPGSPTLGAEVLTAHIKVCEKHPMRAAVRAERKACAKIADAAGAWATAAAIRARQP